MGGERTTVTRSTGVCPNRWAQRPPQIKSSPSEVTRENVSTPSLKRERSGALPIGSAAGGASWSTLGRGSKIVKGRGSAAVQHSKKTMPLEGNRRRWLVDQKTPEKVLKGECCGLAGEQPDTKHVEVQGRITRCSKCSTISKVKHCGWEAR